MKSKISNWEHLEPFGIRYLTSESCGYGLRLLCDVNQQGREAIGLFFGQCRLLPLSKNWNSEVNGEPAVGSVMLPRSIFRDLAAFLLLEEGHEVIVIRDHEVSGCSREMYEKHQGAPIMQDARILFNQGYSRNQHQFTGRTE